MTNARFRRLLSHSLLVFLAAAALLASAQDRRNEAEWAKRDAWQRPGEVMDALGIGPGSSVADIGAGRGYFTLRLAERVGAQGHVYAVDIDEGSLGRLRERAERDNLKQVATIHSSASDPKLEQDSVNAILVVNAYHEMRDFDAMLQGMLRGLKPCGLLGVIDHEASDGRPRADYYPSHHIPESLVRADAARNGFRFVAKKPGFHTGDGDDWFFVIFEKPAAQCRPASSGM
jgi:predicted methyltransferase